jgi:DNA-binding Lrp family transcriptional regulator
MTELDALDRALVRALQDDARQTNRDLAAAVHAAPSTSSERVRALRATGGVFVVSGGDDFLLHVAVPDTDALYAFVIDRLTERREVADVRTSVVYEHIRRPVLEPLGSDSRT